jgi:hypothetical protein
MAQLHSLARIMGVGLAAVTCSVVLLAACGGGGGSSGPTGSMGTPSGANAGATSSGAITAFGSVFVNKHEFDTKSATVVDDDTNASSSAATGLEVGMVVDVKAASDSSDAKPVAAELHVHPLAKGYVDASSGASITVMGQTVQLTPSTVVSDHRACVSALVSHCAAITGQGGLAVTTGPTAPGSYVSVHGYLFNGGSGAFIEATLVSIHDAPTASASGAVFKAEGPVTAASGPQVTIGALNVDLSTATCYVKGDAKPCANLYSVGQVVSVFSKTQPALPATTLVADVARLRPRVVVETPGATVELEGKVSSVNGTSSFVVRGITVDASGLPAGTTLPAVGDHIEVVGTVAMDGQSIKATKLEMEHRANSAMFGFEGDVSNVTGGAGTFTLTVLGQTVTVDVNTRLADHSMGDWDKVDPTTNPFNINTFDTYLAASASKHVRVKAWADSTGKLTALGFVIVPASGNAAVVGRMDATPAPANGAPTTFSIHGVGVSADPAAVRRAGDGGGVVTIAAGDWVAALGTSSGGSVTVGPTLSRNNAVIDFGTALEDEMEGF